MKMLRVENAQGYGPYHSGMSMYAHKNFFTDLNGNEWTHQPSPSYDPELQNAWLIQILDCEASKYHFGFVDSKQLFRWWPPVPSLWRTFRFLGFGLAEHEVPEDKVFIGTSQAIFIPNRVRWRITPKNGDKR